jgi:proteasome accessory factor A
MTPGPSIETSLPSVNAPKATPKVLGSDVELGNFVLGLERENGTGAIASRALLREIEGVPGLADAAPGQLVGSSSHAESAKYDPQDWGRKYLPANGGCFYIDLDHLECCTPEVLSAYDFAAAFHAMLRIARTAVRAANARLREGLKIVAVVNNEDGQGHSYGSHLNVLVSRATWDRLFHRRMHQLMTLASFQVSSIILTGQGKVSRGRNTGNGANGFYEISQRASFCECLVGTQTTYYRPLVNSRDEALCGRLGALGCPADNFARLHCIFFDATLCPASIVLRAGLMQILLALLERDEGAADLNLVLEDPVETVARWSRDPLLETRARLLTGQEITAVELQRLFFEKARRFVEAGGCEGVVPAAREILTLWADTLDQLSQRDFGALAPRLDWVLKLQLLERAIQQHPHLDWGSPEIKHLDLKYAELEDGLFWACERAGATEPAGVTEEQIQRFTREPPDNTRAWTRARLLRLAEPDSVAEVDWDRITFRLRQSYGAEKRRTIALSNPLGLTRQHAQAVFQRSETLDEALDLLGAPDRDPPAYSSSGYWIAGSPPAATVSTHQTYPSNWGRGSGGRGTSR